MLRLPLGLWRAAEEGDANAVAAWLDEGGSVDARSKEQNGAALLGAAALGGQEAMVRMLLQRGATVNLQSWRKGGGHATALHCAACNGFTAIVQALLDAKANASLQTIDGRTADMWAEQEQGYTTIAQLLRQHTKQLTAKAETRVAASAEQAPSAAEAVAEGLPAEVEVEAERVAAKKGKGKKKKVKAAPSTVAAEPTAVASLASAAMGEGLPGAVEQAAREGNAQAVVAWLDEGGDVDSRGLAQGFPEGGTLLVAATAGAQEAVVRLLLQRGASVNLPYLGVTALIDAAGQGHITIVQTLLDAKADVSHQAEPWGLTALMCAEGPKFGEKQQSHEVVAQLLRQRMAAEAEEGRLACVTRRMAEAEARAAASAVAEAAAAAMAEELLAEDKAEKEATAKRGKGKKKNSKATPKKVATGANSSLDSASKVPGLPSQVASGPTEDARAAQKVAEEGQAEATAQPTEEARALEEGIAQSVASHKAEEQRRAATQAASPPTTLLPPSAPPQSPSPPPLASPLVLTYLELQTATRNFAQVVGTGGFASVYRTEGALPSLPHHGPCAVKRLTVDTDATGGGCGGGRGGGRGRGRGGGRGDGRGGRDCGGVPVEMLKEVALLGRCTPHASLLPLLGYCLESSLSPCLVYPLCAGGTLEDRVLRDGAGRDRLAALGWAELPAVLLWWQRLTILRDVARALTHLHAQQPVLLHGDVVPWVNEWPSAKRTMAPEA